MRRKILAISILVMMLATSFVGMGATNWIKSVQVEDFNANKWDEYKEANWEIADDDMDTYYWNYSVGSNYGYSINTESTTNRGFNFYVSQANGTDFATIFSYVSDTDFHMVWIQPSGAVSVWNWNGTDATMLSADYTAIDSFDETWPMCTKTIYNRYTGHLQFKIWPFMVDEPRNWTIDITQENLEREQSTKWGLWAEGSLLGDSNMFAWYAVQELPYDMIGGVPTITASDIDYDDFEEMFEGTGSPLSMAEEIALWNSLDLQVLQVYPLSDHLDDNIYIYSGWDIDEMKLGFMIWVCADDSDETTPSWDSDYVYVVLDMDHDHEFSEGDKRVFYSANETTGLNLATYDGDSWEDDTSAWAEVTTEFDGYDMQMMRDYRKWYVAIDLEEIIGDEDAVWEFVDDTDEIGLQLFGYGTLAPGWAWSSWNRETNESIPYAEAGMNASNYGDLRLGGESPNPDYVDLIGSTMFSADESSDVIQYDSSVCNVPRWAINAQMMRDEDLLKINVPTKVNKSYWILWSKEVNVEELVIYSVNVTGEVVHTPIDYEEDDGYAILDEIPEDADAIVVVPNPSWLDTNSYMYNWLYGEYAITVSE